MEPSRRQGNFPLYISDLTLPPEQFQRVATSSTLSTQPSWLSEVIVLFVFGIGVGVGEQVGQLPS
jgi:hypothetical protein